METTLVIRNRIHDFIDHADERILNILNAIILADEAEVCELSLENKRILDERLENHKQNPNSGKHWKELKQELKLNYGL